MISPSVMRVDLQINSRAVAHKADLLNTVVGARRMVDVIIKNVNPEDIQTCHDIEVACFSESEAASMEKIRRRARIFQEGFLVAQINRQVVGFINSGATDNPDLSDEDFKDLVGHDSNGRNMVVLSIAVAPRYQGSGISRPLMENFIVKARVLGKQAILLLCKKNMISYYEKFGYEEAGASASTHGGGRWHEMRLDL